MWFEGSAALRRSELKVQAVCCLLLGADAPPAPTSHYMGRTLAPAFGARDLTYASPMPVVTSASYVVPPGKMMQSKERCLFSPLVLLNDTGVF